MRPDRRLIEILNEPLEISERPFLSAARRLGLTEKELLSKIKAGKKRGLIRRIGAVLDQRLLGLTANALVVWRIEENRIDSAGRICSQLPEVTHCYARRTRPGWPYNLYTMVHAESRKRLNALIKEIAQKIRASDFRVMLTRKQLKKTRAFIG